MPSGEPVQIRDATVSSIYVVPTDLPELSGVRAGLGVELKRKNAAHYAA